MDRCAWIGAKWRQECRRQSRRTCRAIRPCASSTGRAPFGLLLECDGVLIDTHKDGHRVAFNSAFSEMGLDCSNWSPSVYHDLLRCGDGSAEGLLRAFFDTIGWPTMLATADREPFVNRLHAAKRKHLAEMVQSGSIPLRKGAAELVREALEAGAKVGIIAGTCSTPEERIADAALAALGPGMAERLNVYVLGESMVADEDKTSAPGQELSLERQFANAQAKVKEDEASAFILSLQADTEASVPLGIDPAMLLAAKRGKAGLSAAFLAACLATMDLPLRRCAAVAANNSVLQAAQSAGILAAAVPPALSAQGTFNNADAKFDGFGPGGGVTWRRLEAMLAKAIGEQ
ncbi:hypothetical protein WJX75_006354 [Coccomyxa subellipsoidea]|uniref:HAD-like protein n=1 Tax=Coccomyxa subellipsoidea TaxID=248742 RepID=A0ABR2YBP6_9CHLO